MKAFPAGLVAMMLAALLPSGVWSQAPPTTAAEPKFEVASVKLNKSGDGNSRWTTGPGGRMTASNIPLRALVLAAYKLQDFQLINLPEWAASERYDIAAKAQGTATDEEQLLMVQSLLAERFALVAHKDRREMPVYALVLAVPDWRPGPQLIKSTIDCAELERTNAPPPPKPVPTAKNPQPLEACEWRSNVRGRAATLTGAALSMPRLASVLSDFAERTVIDQTGVSDSFDVNLTWTPNQTAATAGPSLFTALQEQLGLKLQSTRGPVDVLVVDRVARPTPN